MNLYRELQNKESGEQSFQNNRKIQYIRLKLCKIKNAKWQINLHTGEADF